MSEPTKRPWNVQQDTNGEVTQFWIFGPNGRFGYPTMICTRGVKSDSQTTVEEVQANFDLICTSLNAHEAMKEALERVLYVLSYQGTDLEELAGEDLEEVVKAALALAKKENQP